MYDGTRTTRDENLVKSWDLDGGELKAYLVIDTDADGDAYGVIVTDPSTGSEASLWDVYDDGAGYIETVAEELALELRAARGETDAQESIDAKGESIPTHWDVVCDRCGETFIPTGEEDDPENPDHYARLDGAECGGHAVVRVDGEHYIDNRGVAYVPDGRGWLDLPAGWAMCGTCYRAWDDTTPTSVTPTPSGRCPFEYGH